MDIEDINSVVFEDVSFSYPNSDINIFNKISFNVSPGEFVCLL